MIVRNARVPSGSSSSEPITIPDGHVLVRVRVPGAITSTSLSLQVSNDNGATHQNSFNLTAFSQGIAINESHAINPVLTLGSNSVILKLNASETSDRFFSCSFEPA
jgi:hypothetical protein